MNSHLSTSFFLLVSVLAGFSAQSMEQNVVNDNGYEIFTLSENVDSFNATKDRTIPSMNPLTLSGLAYELTGDISAVAFSPDDTIIITGSINGLICIWEAKSGKILKKCGNHTRKINSIICSSDGAFFITGCSDGTAGVWDLKTGENLLAVRSHNPFSSVKSLACSSKGDIILVGFNEYNKQFKSKACLIDLKNKKVQHSFYDLERIDFLTFNADNSVALIQCYSEEKGAIIDLYSTENGKHVKRIHSNSRAIDEVHYSPERTTFALLIKDRSVAILDSSTGDTLLRVAHTKRFIPLVVFNSYGNTLITNSLKQDNEDWIVDINTTLLEEITKKEGDRIIDLHASASGFAAFTYAKDSCKCYLWHPKKESTMVVLKWPASRFNATVAFSQDGKSLLTGTKDKIIRLWDTTTKELLLELKSDDHLPEVGFSPCEKVIFAKGRYTREKIHIWVRSEAARTLSFTEAINLDDDSQKECSIQ